MTQLVYQLADLTALRDRDSLDTALVATLQELVHPETLAIYRLVGPASNERWLNCAQMQDGIEQGRARQDWTELDELPPAADFATRQQALQNNQLVVSDTTPTVYVFPLTTQSASKGVLELVCQVSISKETITLVSAVLRLYQNFQGLLDYGERDALTELLNRKTFDGAFLKATAAQHSAQALAAGDRRHDRAGDTYWLAMADIDHFKHVNDNYGHLIGDEVLLLLARLMRDTFRFQDQLYRFGGEEFVVLLSCTQGSQAEAAFERLRRDTEKHNFPQVGRITISVGFTEIRHGDSPSGAFERADKAVYYAKEHGRNQVCRYETLVAQGHLADEKTNVGEIELF
jgi:diguanylate cyclase (GGDEF)-like protein